MRTVSVEKIREVKNAIDQALADGAEPIAAFDADGTLWDMDLGEDFFDYQIRAKLLPGLPIDPWDHYRAMHAQDTEAAFLWLAQINRGISENQVREWAQKAVDEIAPLPIFESIREIIDHLHAANVKVYVVTASIKWAVEPGAALFGIPHERVIGVTTKVADGIMTDTQDGVVTWREGKVKGLLAKTGGKKPFLAAGNTMGDLALLESATHLRIANCAVGDGHNNFATEQKLLAHAREHNWFSFVY